RVPRRMRNDAHIDRADLSPAGILRDATAESLADDLMAEADPEERSAGGGDAAHELLGAEHPRRALRDAARRARDDEAVRVARPRKRSVRADVVLHPLTIPCVADLAPDPREELAIPRGDGRSGISGAKNNQFHNSAVRLPRPSRARAAR